MKNNKAIRAVVKDYLKDLTTKEILELLPEDGKARKELIIKMDNRGGGNYRVVRLPDISAQSEFDEIMETFRGVHFMTEIQSTNKTIILEDER